MPPVQNNNISVHDLPQKGRSLLVDNIIEHEFGKRILVSKVFYASDDYFDGHFPNKPILPGHYLIEASFQATQLMMMDEKVKEDLKFVKKRGLALKVKEFKFIKPIFPDDEIIISSVHEETILNFITAKIMVTNNSKEKVAQGRIIVGMVDVTDEQK